MRQTLRQCVIPTVPAKHDRAEQHLHPPKHGVRLSDDAMRAHGPGPQRPFVYVQLEVHAKCELRSKHSEEEICERAMCARRELPAAVCVPQDVTSKSERDTRGLLRILRETMSKRRRRSAHL